ncbi:MAG: hypothetical protein ACLQPD_06910 [Desulfomonilaceae bacterium]
MSLRPERSNPAALGIAGGTGILPVISRYRRLSYKQRPARCRSYWKSSLSVTKAFTG